jgi:hypothetical protein
MPVQPLRDRRPVRAGPRQLPDRCLLIPRQNPRPDHKHLHVETTSTRVLHRPHETKGVMRLEASVTTRAVAGCRHETESVCTAGICHAGAGLSRRDGRRDVAMSSLRLRRACPDWGPPCAARVDGAVIVADATHGRHPPSDLPGVTHSILVRVDDVYAHHDKARSAGAVIVSPPVDMPFGERQYSVTDPAGHHWTFTQSIADVAPENWGGQTVTPW